MKRFLKISLATVMAVSLLQGCGGGSSSNENGYQEDLTDTSTKPSKNEQLGTMGEVGSKPTKEKLYYLIKKLEYKGDENITTTYGYKDGYLAEENQSSTLDYKKQTIYRYFKNHKVLKSFDGRDNLKDIIFFKPLSKSHGNNIYDKRISQNPDIHYMLSPVDELLYLDKSYISKKINKDKTGMVFEYDKHDLLKKVIYGEYDELTAETLEKMKDDNLKFTPSQYIEYHYKNGLLKSVQFHAEGKELKTDVTTSFYDDGKLEDLNFSSGDSLHYGKDGLLKSKTGTIHSQKIVYNYDYKNDGKQITVTDTDGNVVKTYIFDEINRGD